MTTITLNGPTGQRWIADTDELAREFWDWAGDGRYALGENRYHFLPQLDVAVSVFLDFHLRAKLRPLDTIALQRSIQESGPPA